MAFENVGLVTKDKIEVPASHGSCEIHLCYGSVTKLPKDDQVDVLVVSAFPNSYAETRYSVIGALKRDLDISVGCLSKDKEEDLRNIFSCWWSKELPDDKSFRRILCFEGSYKPCATPTSVIGEIFRCLISMSKGSDIKVMMPLLSTGHQGFEFKTILSLIVEAAIHWMEIGLQLRILKIVVYAKDVKQIKDDLLLNHFGMLKEKWLDEQEERKKRKLGHPINYDVYLSYFPGDQGVAESIVKKLKALYADICIFSQRQEIDREKTWQDHIYKVMVSCARIITVINQNFLTDEACLEQYNIALCCSRNMKRDYLAPFYVETIETMPTYMSLVQYIDCRPLSDEKLSGACSVVTDWLNTNLQKLKGTLHHQEKLERQPEVLMGDHYDVFISYSHKNSEAAHQIKHHISILYPDWKIFIDVSDLKTGVVWQTKLYNSIERSKVVMCLISPSYLSSKVCQEEYNLSMALHCDPAYSTVLFPILVEPVEALPSWCRDYSPLDLAKTSITEFLGEVQLLKEYDRLWKPRPIYVPKLLADWRTQFFASDFPNLSNLTHKALQSHSSSGMVERKSPNFVLCYHHSDKSSASFFAKRLFKYASKPVVQRPKQSERSNALIDQADIVVLFLSRAFVESPKLVEEANVALCRQRWSDSFILLPMLLEELPDHPAYFKLFLNLFSYTDDKWKDSRFPLLPRLSCCFSINSKKAAFLDNVALFAGFLASNPSVAKGDFKTLLSLQELSKSVKYMSEGSSSLLETCNPLLFNESQLPSSVTHTIVEKLPASSHLPGPEPGSESPSNED